MPCLEQFPLRAGSPQCIYSCVPHTEPRMGSRMILVSILGTCLRTAQKDVQNWCPRQSMLPHIPKFQTRPLNHNPHLRLCRPHPLPMSLLYTAPNQCGYNGPGSLCRQKHNTRGISVLYLFCTEEPCSVLGVRKDVICLQSQRFWLKQVWVLELYDAD